MSVEVVAETRCVLPAMVCGAAHVKVLGDACATLHDQRAGGWTAAAGAAGDRQCSANAEIFAEVSAHTDAETTCHHVGSHGRTRRVPRVGVTSQASDVKAAADVCIHAHPIPPVITRCAVGTVGRVLGIADASDAAHVNVVSEVGFAVRVQSAGHTHAAGDHGGSGSGVGGVGTVGERCLAGDGAVMPTFRF